MDEFFGSVLHSLVEFLEELAFHPVIVSLESSPCVYGVFLDGKQFVGLEEYDFVIVPYSYISEVSVDTDYVLWYDWLYLF